MTKVVGQLGEIVNALIFASVIVALMFEFRLDMLWGGINALQIICCMSYCNVAWPVNIGFLFTMLGIVSEYVGLIYEEVKQRPNFVVRTKVGLDDD